MATLEVHSCGDRFWCTLSFVQRHCAPRRIDFAKVLCLLSRVSLLAAGLPVPAADLTAARCLTIDLLVQRAARSIGIIATIETEVAGVYSGG